MTTGYEIFVEIGSTWGVPPYLVRYDYYPRTGVVLASDGRMTTLELRTGEQLEVRTAEITGDLREESAELALRHRAELQEALRREMKLTGAALVEKVRRRWGGGGSRPESWSKSELAWDIVQSARDREIYEAYGSVGMIDGYPMRRSQCGGTDCVGHDIPTPQPETLERYRTRGAVCVERMGEAVSP